MWTNTGTIRYRAPEMFQGPYNKQVDMWAVGVIAYEMIFGKLPFEGEHMKDIIDKIIT